MEIYCLRCKKNTANENSSVKRTKQNRLMLVSSCVLFVARKNRVSSKAKKKADYWAN